MLFFVVCYFIKKKKNLSAKKQKKLHLCPPWSLAHITSDNSLKKFWQILTSPIYCSASLFWPWDLFCVFNRLVENWDFTVKFQKLTIEKRKLQMNGLDHLISWSWGLCVRVSFLAGPIKILSTKPLACVRNSWLCCEFLSRCLMVFTGSSTRESQVGIWQQQWY